MHIPLPLTAVDLRTQAGFHQILEKSLGGSIFYKLCGAKIFGCATFCTILIGELMCHACVTFCATFGIFYVLSLELHMHYPM